MFASLFNCFNSISSQQSDYSNAQIFAEDNREVLPSEWTIRGQDCVLYEGLNSLAAKHECIKEAKEKLEVLIALCKEGE